MFNERFHHDVRLFGLSHLIVLAVCAAVLVAIAVNRRRFAENPKLDRAFRLTAASLMTAFELGFLIWSGLRGDIPAVIPLELCSIMLWVTAFAAFFGRWGVFRIIFFWAVIGATLPFFIVTAGYAFPHFRFFHYFTVHFMILLLNLYPVVIGKISLRYRDAAISAAVLLCVGGAVYPFDLLLHANYMFLIHLPRPLEAVSVRLGGWYLPVLAATGVAGLHLVYGAYRGILVLRRALARCPSAA